MRSLPFFLVLVIAVGGFSYFGKDTVRTLPKAGQYDRYFPTPKASVDTVTDLVQAGDWATLATYYDLTGIDTEPGLVTSAAFLSTEDSAAEAAPLQYVHPFPLGARFNSIKPLGNDEVEVTVILDMPWTEDGGEPKTETFRLKAHPEGYKLIPKH